MCDLSSLAMDSMKSHVSHMLGPHQYQREMLLHCCALEQVWDTASGQLKLTLTGHIEQVTPRFTLPCHTLHSPCAPRATRHTAMLQFIASFSSVVLLMPSFLLRRC